MNIWNILLFCIVLAQCGGNTGLADPQLPIFTGREGESGTIFCHLNKSGSTKFFCRDECQGDDVLVKTDGARANSGKYNLTYSDKSSELGVMSVTITNLTQSDSGRYRCSFGKSLLPGTFSDFEVRVTHESFTKDYGFIQTNTEGENVTYPCQKAPNTNGFFFCKDTCTRTEDILIETDLTTGQSGRYSIKYDDSSTFGLYVTITRAKKSDTGWYKCGYGRPFSPDASSAFPVIIVEATTTTAKATTAAATTATTATTAVTKAATTTTITTAAATTAATTTTTAVTKAATTTTETTAAATTAAMTATTASTTATTTATTATTAATTATKAATTTTTITTAAATTAAAPTTPEPNWTLQPFSTSTSDSSQSSTSLSFGFRESTEQPAAAALSTSPAKTTAQSSSSTSGGSTTLVSPETTEQSAAAASSNGAHPGFVSAVCVPVVSVSLMGASFLFRHVWKKMHNSQHKHFNHFV
ncbi:hypothetical protein Q5P01_007122 [Channa striata]|uniref:Immunoglobulin domain-containing protein n=1 Tax=Channa striata TaxID=64152 RepID=A0AA88NBB5_CHASR|nr:hypothetical protein Q5P01_007122 [Channa striata]